MQPSLHGYLTLLVSPFFRWWWSAITGFASVLAFFLTPSQGLTLAPPLPAIAIFLGFMMTFLVLSVITQGYSLYIQRFPQISVHSIEKCEDYGGTHLVIVGSTQALPNGLLVELRRPIGNAEPPFALVQVLD